MIDVQKLTYSYRDGTDILRGVSFSLGGGHCLAILGNNGAGKSTLLKCLDRIIEPQGGTAAVCGHELHTLHRSDIAKTVSYVAQEADAGQCTVFDCVLLGRKPYIKLAPGAADLAIVESVIERMGLSALALRPMNQLSGGERQKAMIARALAQQPDVLLLDEPTSSLDLHNQHEVLRIVQEIAQKDGILAVLVLHDLNLALAYCDRFLFLKDGGVYSFGDIETVTPQVIEAVYGLHVHMIDYLGARIVVPFPNEAAHHLHTKVQK